MKHSMAAAAVVTRAEQCNWDLQMRAATRDTRGGASPAGVAAACSTCDALTWRLSRTALRPLLYSLHDARSAVYLLLLRERLRGRRCFAGCASLRSPPRDGANRARPSPSRCSATPSRRGRRRWQGARNAVLRVSAACVQALAAVAMEGPLLRLLPCRRLLSSALP